MMQSKTRIEFLSANFSEDLPRLSCLDAHLPPSNLEARVLCHHYWAERVLASWLVILTFRSQIRGYTVVFITGIAKIVAFDAL